jgi:hypothetical protein
LRDEDSGVGTADSQNDDDSSADDDTTALEAGELGDDGSEAGAVALRPDAGSPEEVTESGAPSGVEQDASACAKGEVAANELLIIGDSFFGRTHQVTAYLEAFARESGALALGERYRDNSRLLNNALAYQGEGIADQYASAVEESAVEVVIMNGGGADALLGECDTTEPICPALADAANAAERLLSEMSDDAVSDVVYVFYPNPPDEALRERVGALRPLVQAACEGSSVNCHWLDLRPIFEGNYDEYLPMGGLYPTDEGAEATARGIWSLMQRECIAQ